MTESPLKSKWSLMFLPAITGEILKEHKGDYQAAQKKLLNNVGDITTIEQACSTMNSLPMLSKFQPKDTILFVREGFNPSFECFPQGLRLIIDSKNNASNQEVFQAMLMGVLGENCAKKLSCNSPCHIIRISHKPSQECQELVRFEVWMEKTDKSAQIKEYFQSLFLTDKDKEIKVENLM